MFFRVGTQAGMVRMALGGRAAPFSALDQSPLPQVLPDAQMPGRPLQPHKQHGLCAPRAGLHSLALEGTEPRIVKAPPRAGDRGGISSHLGWRKPSWELTRVRGWQG